MNLPSFQKREQHLKIGFATAHHKFNNISSMNHVRQNFDLPKDFASNKFPFDINSA